MLKLVFVTGFLQPKHLNRNRRNELVRAEFLEFVNILNDRFGSEAAVRITSHYSAAEIKNLIDSANRVTQPRKTPELTVLNMSRGHVSD